MLLVYGGRLRRLTRERSQVQVPYRPPISKRCQQTVSLGPRESGRRLFGGPEEPSLCWWNDRWEYGEGETAVNTLPYRGMRSRTDRPS